MLGGKIIGKGVVLEVNFFFINFKFGIKFFFYFL